MADDDEDTQARAAIWRQMHPLLRHAVIAVLIEQQAKTRVNDAFNAVRDHAVASAVAQMAEGNPEAAFLSMGLSHGVSAGQLANGHSRTSIDNAFDFVIDWLSDGLDEDERSFKQPNENG